MNTEIVPRRARPAHKRSRLENKLLRQVGKACEDYRLVEPGDRIMVCVSGGKDSLAMLYLLAELQRRVPWEFALVAVHLDQKQPGYPEGVLARYFEAEGYEWRIIERDTYSVVTEKLAPGETYCALCSRLRRGILYDAAVELGCNKLALGHHREDVNETLLLNLFYGGQLKTMPPRLVSDDGRNVVIRPLVTCTEADLAAFALERRFPVLPCGLCGSQENLKRAEMKALIARLAEENPKVPTNMLAAVHNVIVSHLFDPTLARREQESPPPGRALEGEE